MNRKVGVWVNQSKPGSQTLGINITDWFQKRGWTVFTEWNDIVRNQAEFIISLGGDGTLLESAREAAPFGIPVLGINLGRLGFLCEIEQDDIYLALDQVVEGRYTIEKRLMLCGFVPLDGEGDTKVRALNDVVFQRDTSGGLVTLEIRVSGEVLASIPADGLIISTPTGSTAYSLSAGGPILAPTLKAILINHLAAHSLSTRPMVISHEEELEVKLIRGGKCRLSFDGVKSFYITEGTTIRIKTAPISALFMRLGTRTFAGVLREKLSDRWHD